MENVLNHLFDWLILGALLAGACYTLVIIRRESSDFIDDSYEVRFGRLSLPIPEWWTITKQEDQRIEFARTDTRYDWYARFEFHPGQADRPLHELLNAKVEAEELDYDKDDVVLETMPSHVFKEPATREYFPEVIRVEGKASQRIEERVYFDMYLFRGPAEDGYYLFESRSSVLNGLVEGPFFEESISRMVIREKPEEN